MVDYLYKKGAEINDQDIYFNTSLHYAAMKKHRNVIIYLLKHGALRLNNIDGKKPKIPKDLKVLYGGNNLEEKVIVLKKKKIELPPPKVYK